MARRRASGLLYPWTDDMWETLEKRYEAITSYHCSHWPDRLVMLSQYLVDRTQGLRHWGCYGREARRRAKDHGEW